jgi:aspartate kinase
MSREPVIVKLGGDALASPERIAAAARRVQLRAAAGPVVAVASARRGVTDHLLGLVEEVRSATGGFGTPVSEADRAVAAGEVVAASLLALALQQLGVQGVSLDAREAGLRTVGRAGHAHIGAVATRRLTRLLQRDAVPVVTGFQGWNRGRVVTLGRGATDVTAVALAAALEAGHAEFVKDAHGLRTADPKLVAEAQVIREAPHAFLSALATAGARVIHPEAARLAERRGLTLQFHPLEDEGPLTTVSSLAPQENIRAVATAPTDGVMVRLTALSNTALEDSLRLTESLHRALRAESIPVIEVDPEVRQVSVTVPAVFGAQATRIVHSIFVLNATVARDVRRAS